ncbi:glycosyltransferase family 4 protein [Micromonospora sp. NPDC023956]|uniref:glycosyltransferase family 4 protein n=1 Tax=Micromonospora sp. NPDC023956 TaxID=3155722 RepID=UPI0033E267C3
MPDNSAPRGVLSMTPFFLYADHQKLWKPRFDPMGGMHVLGHAIVTEMGRRGFPQRVLTMAPPGIPKDLQIAPNITVHARRLPVLPIPSKLEGYFGLVGAWAKASLLYVMRNKEQLKREIGIVHAHCDGSGSAPAYAYAAAKVLDVPIVSHIYSCRSLTQHPTTVFERVADPVAKSAEKYVIQNSGAVLTLSDKVRERIRDELHVPDDRVHRLAHLVTDDFVGHDTPERREELRQRFGLTDDKPTVLYVGRISSEKGVDWFVKAAAEVNKRRDCRFLIAGDGPQRGDIEALARQLGVADKLVITGFLLPEYIPSIISLSTLAVLPSQYEELGVVVLEYMMMKRPVVAHDVSGVHKLVEHMKTGVLVPPFDPPKLADAIEMVLDDPDLARRLAENAEPIPQQEYSLASAGERLQAIYLSLMEES